MTTNLSTEFLTRIHNPSLIMEIMKFVVVSIDATGTEYRLFGRMPHDHTRKIVYIFPCIRFLRRSSGRFFYGASKIEHLECSYQDCDFIVRNAERLNRLRILRIEGKISSENGYGNQSFFYDLFEHKFPSLSKLHLSLGNERSQVFLHSIFYDNAFKSCEDISVLHLKNFKSSTKPKPVILSKLSSLKLVNCSLPKYKIFCQNARHVLLEKCTNVEIIPGNELLSLEIKDCEDDEIFQHFQHVWRIDKVYIRRFTSRVSQNFVSFFSDKSKEYRDVVLELGRGYFSPIFGSKLDRFCLTFIGSWGSLHIPIEDWECPKLGHLELSNVSFSTNFRNETIENIRCIDFCNLDDLQDSFFRNHQFKRLEKLKLVKCPKITGSDWKDMPNVRKIELIELVDFGDTFFQENESISENLECLYINSCPVEGQGWTFLEGLKEISMLECPLKFCFFKMLPFYEKRMKKMLFNCCVGEEGLPENHSFWMGKYEQEVVLRMVQKEDNMELKRINLDLEIENKDIKEYVELKDTIRDVVGRKKKMREFVLGDDYEWIKKKKKRFFGLCF